MEGNMEGGQRGPRKEGRGMVVFTWVAMKGLSARIDE